MADYELELELTRAQRFRAWLLSWRGAVLAALLLLALAAVLAGPRLYRWAKERRAHGLVERGIAAGERGDVPEAAKLFRQALLMDPGDHGVRREVASFFERANPPAALSIYAELAALPGASFADRRGHALMLAKVGRAGEARPLLEGLQAEDPRDPEVLVGLAELYLELRDGTALARVIDQMPRDLAAADLIRARAAIAAGGWTEENLREMERLARREDAQAARATTILAGAVLAGALDAYAEEGRFDGLPGRLRTQPSAGLREQLLAASLELRARPGDRESILGRLMEVAGGLGPAERIGLGRWLVANGAPALALEISDAGMTAEKGDLFLVRLDALALLDNWGRVEEEVRADETLLDPALRQTFLARAALQLGRQAEAESAWAEARRLVRESPAQVALYVARYGELLGRPQDAALIYRRLAGTEGGGQEAFLGLVRCGGAALSTRELRDLMAEFAAAHPGHDEVANDLAYLNLLLGEDVATQAARAAALVGRRPDMLAFRMTAALGALKAGQPEAAHGYLDFPDLDWAKLPAPWRAIKARVLRANGRETEASAIEQSIDKGQLRPEEREGTSYQ